MLDNKFKPGFSQERLGSVMEPKVHKDEDGYYIMTLSENVKVYFEDYYTFLEKVYERCMSELSELEDKISNTAFDNVETISYYRAKKIIVDIATNIRTWLFNC